MATEQKQQYEFSAYDGAFHDAPESKGNSYAPVGKYIADVESAEKVMEDGATRAIKITTIIVEGNQANCLSSVWVNLPQKTDKREEGMRKLGWLKTNLKRCGVEIDDPKFSLGEFIDRRLNDLQGARVEIEVKPRTDDPDKTTTFINRFISKPEGASASSAADDSFSPFDDGN
jgi:hypothetical protein